MVKGSPTTSQKRFGLSSRKAHPTGLEPVNNPTLTEGRPSSVQRSEYSNGLRRPSLPLPALGETGRSDSNHFKPWSPLAYRGRCKEGRINGPHQSRSCVYGRQKPASLRPRKEIRPFLHWWPITLKQTAQRTGGFSDIARIVGQCSFAQ